VEELILRSFFFGEKVDVVDNEHVGLTPLLSKRLEGRIPGGGHEAAGEGFRGEKGDFKVGLLEKAVTDTLE
jgi:hypothetical protein